MLVARVVWSPLITLPFKVVATLMVAILDQVLEDVAVAAAQVASVLIVQVIITVLS